MLKTVHRLALTDTTSNAALSDPQTENVRCAGLDLCSAIMTYLALAIKFIRKAAYGSFIFILF
jgi:hypothetical protein